MKASIWDGALHSLNYIYEPGRDAFFVRVAVVPEWSWLALESGRFTYRLGRGKKAMQGECGPGDWVLCPPQEPFERNMLERCVFHFARFGCHHNGLLPLRGPGTLHNTARLRANFAELRQAPPGPEADEWRCHLILDTLLAAHWEASRERAPAHADAAMIAARDWLLHHGDRPLSLQALATEMRLTPPAFSRRFRAAFGVAPQEFLQQHRLDRARQLLLETDLTIDTVARHSGFAGGIYFSRLWTRRYGVPPARFRREHRV